MKRIVLLTLALIIALSAVLPSVGFAASKKKKVIYVVNIDNNGVRVRSTPNGGNNIMTTLKKGTKLFYLGTEGAYYKVCSEYSTKTGYVYKGYVSYYGAVAYDSIFRCDGRTYVYTRPNSSARRSATLKDGQFVIVRAVSGNWAYIYTISGKKGYVKISSLEDID